MTAARQGPPEATVAVEVRYAETDQMGVVHHSNYLVWFELARTRLCETTGWPYAEIERRGTYLMVTGAALTYRRPARYGDTVAVACRLARLGSRGLTFAYEVRRGEEILADGTTDHVWVERTSGRPCRIPAYLRSAFGRLAGGEPPGAAAGGAAPGRGGAGSIAARGLW